MPLVFFFLIATRFGASLPHVDMPIAPALHEAAAGAASILVVRTVTPDRGETLAWTFSDGDGDTRPLPGPEALYFEVSRAVDTDPECTILLRIDGDVRYGVVDDILETVRKAGARNVVFAARVAGGGV
jgi:biopolymer transport protein ExbD